MEDIMKAKWILLSIMAVFIASPMGMAQPMRGTQPCMQQQLEKRLQLNERQRLELKTILADLAKKRVDNRTAHQPMHSAFAGQLSGDKLTKKRLMKLAKTRAAYHAEMVEYQIDQLIKFHKMLTKKQRHELGQMVKDWPQKGMQPPRGFGHCRGRGMVPVNFRAWW